MDPSDASFFDPEREITQFDRRLPHWDQAGTFAFVTCRLIDSLPADCIERIKRQRTDLLKSTNLNPSADLQAEIARLPRREASILRWKLFTAWDDELEKCHGACYLRCSAASKIVADGLLKFNGDRYVVAAFVVMPNHVHLLAAFAKRGAITTQGAAWRQYWAREINSLVGRTGHLWQEDQFDHLIRSPAAFERTRQYIIDNPRKARLPGGEYRLFVSSDW
jgi:putative transposase